MTGFTTFFHSLLMLRPLPLAVRARGAGGGGPWPKTLDLPTASGKTASMDVALYALAAQAELATAERTAPPRVGVAISRPCYVSAIGTPAVRPRARKREQGHDEGRRAYGLGRGQSSGISGSLTWPLWESDADAETIRSLLQLRELSSMAPDPNTIRARGIAAVFRARRIRVGTGANSKLNFSPARAIV